MTDEKKNAGNPFTGLPSEILIGEVLRAATEASEQVKRSGTEYPDLADPGKGDPEKSKTAVFSFRKTGIVRDGEETEELVEIQAPLLSLVPVPSMTLDEVNVNFDMDVVPSVTGQKTDEREPAAGLCRMGPFRVSVKGIAATTAQYGNDPGAPSRYHVDALPENGQMPEGLSRMLDILGNAASPDESIGNPVVKKDRDIAD